MNNLNTPPFNLEAEEAVIGSVLIDPDTYHDAAPILSAKDFHLIKHGWIWDAFSELQSQKQPIDLLTVQTVLDKRGQLIEIGGTAYLTRLITLTPTAYNIGGYANLVRETATRRNILKACSESARLAYESGTDINTLVSNVQKSFFNALDGSVSDTLHSMMQIGGDVWDYVADPIAATRNLLRTGIGAINPMELGALDRSLGGGLQHDTLTIVAGRPGMGKTSLLCQIADNVSEQGGTVFFFSKEMSTKQIYLRIAARRARVNLQKFRLQNYPTPSDTAEANKRLQDEVVKLSERRNLFIDGKKNQTTEQMISLAHNKARRVGAPALILLDHLRLMADDDKNEVKRMGKISWACKRLAGEMDNCVIAAAQLSRAPEDRNDKRPTLRDLRDSGEIEENADVVLFPYRHNYYEDLPDGITEINIAKNRDGDAGPGKIAKVAFISAFTSFEPLAPDPNATLPKPRREPVSYEHD